MAGDWIKMRNNLDRDPRVIAMSDELDLPVLHVVGMLWMVWAWADEHTLDGNAIRVTEKTLNRLVSVPGFAAALRKVGWLEGVDFALSFPRFAEHNGQTAKSRVDNARRVAKCRHADDETPVTHIALPREEKSREEKKEYNPLTPRERFVENHAPPERLRLPLAVDTTRNREWLERWQNARQAKHGHHTPLAMWEPEAMLHADWPEAKWQAALQFSASKGSLSLLDPDNDFSKRSRPAPAVRGPDLSDLPISELRKRALQ